MMGARLALERSFQQSANFLMRLHIAIDKHAANNNVALVPTVDGAYVVSEQYPDVLAILEKTTRQMAQIFNATNDPLQRFIIRSGIAWGTATTYKEAAKSIRYAFNSSHYAAGILLGNGAALAYSAEAASPPFGIIIHESVRACPSLARHRPGWRFHRWWQKPNDTQSLEIATRLRGEMRSYFSYFRNHRLEFEYDIESLDKHEALFSEYTLNLDSCANPPLPGNASNPTNASAVTLDMSEAKKP